MICRGGSRKEIFGGRGGLASHHLGGNNEQNYCVQLSSIKQLMYRNYPENLGWPGQDWGGAVPHGPNIEPPLRLGLYRWRKERTDECPYNAHAAVNLSPSSVDQ